MSCPIAILQFSPLHVRDTDRASLAKEDQLHSQVSKGEQQTQLEVQISKSMDHEALRAVSIVYTASVSQQAKLR